MVQSRRNSEVASFVPQGANQQRTHTTIRLAVWDNSAKIDVPLNQESIIGRSSKEEPLAIDLCPFNAHVLGVSRKHAMIKPAVSGCYLIDLNSTNGTILNSQALVPHQSYPLKSGDEIQIGGVYLHVSFI